jgi:hypothetical protein
LLLHAQLIPCLAVAVAKLLPLELGEKHSLLGIEEARRLKKKCTCGLHVHANCVCMRLACACDLHVHVNVHAVYKSRSCVQCVVCRCTSTCRCMHTCMHMAWIMLVSQVHTDNQHLLPSSLSHISCKGRCKLFIRTEFTCPVGSECVGGSE